MKARGGFLLPRTRKPPNSQVRYGQFDFQPAGNCCRVGDPRAVSLRANSVGLGCDSRASPAMTPQPSLVLSLGERVQGAVSGWFPWRPKRLKSVRKFRVFAETTELYDPLLPVSRAPVRPRAPVRRAFTLCRCYCVARHLGLVGLGHASGDAQLWLKISAVPPSQPPRKEVPLEPDAL